MTEQLKLKSSNFYPINFEKLEGESVDTIPYFLGILSFSEDYQYFDKIKHLLDIPEQPKSIEEIQKELDEKFEKLLVKTKRKFDVSKQSAEIRFEKFCHKQNAVFEYAKEHGQFPQYLYLSTTGNVSLGNGIVPNSYLTVGNSGLQWGTEFRFGKGNVGYYCIEPDVKFHMSKKPNFIVRFFMNKCLGFKWRDV
jgi:hypothetical protein